MESASHRPHHHVLQSPWARPKDLQPTQSVDNLYINLFRGGLVCPLKMNRWRVRLTNVDPNVPAGCPNGRLESTFISR